MQKIPTWPDPDLLIECKKLVYASAILHRPRRTQLFIPLTTTTATEIWWFCTNNHNKKFKFSLLKIGILLQFGAKLYLNCQSRPLFVYFRTFLITISIIQIEKSVFGVLGIWTRGRKMVEADKTTELWRPPCRKSLSQNYLGRSLPNKWNHF